MPLDKEKTDKLRLRRVKQGEEETTPPEEANVSAGAVGKGMDLAFNPSREKIREVTIIDRVQGRLFPLMDMINSGWQYIMEIATYRQNKDDYKKLFHKVKPLYPNLGEGLLYRYAQWQKSIAGINLQKITDIALAEIEAQGRELEMPGGTGIDEG